MKRWTQKGQARAAKLVNRARRRAAGKTKDTSVRHAVERAKGLFDRLLERLPIVRSIWKNTSNRERRRQEEAAAAAKVKERA